MALVDFAGNTKASKVEKFLLHDVKRLGFLNYFTAKISSFLAHSDHPADLIREINVAFPGVVQTDEGVVSWSPFSPDQALPVSKTLQERFGCPSFVSNDTNMVAAALHWKEPEKYRQNFAVVLLDKGLGMALFLDGKLYSGANGMAGELGHCCHIPEGALCRCGRQGCLEAYLGSYALFRQASNLPQNTLPQDIVEPDGFVESLIRQAETGHPETLSLFERAGVNLGIGIGRLKAILDPDAFVVTGTSAQAMPFMKGGIEKALAQTLPPGLNQSLVVDVLPWDTDYVFKGLLASTIERLDYSKMSFSLARSTIRNQGLKENAS
ncbi:ROK family protein [Roseibium hamelinense]|uniref:ROK family protein n=1 Tax=Roseibium hamelinense TaxID=150831 RepID=UPI001FCB89DC|nr:ROK family protein [Roseibium hamelinense]